MWLRGTLDAKHPIHRGLSYRHEYQALAKVCEQHLLKPKPPVTRCFVHTESGACLVVAPIPHWADEVREPTRFTWRWGVFHWQATPGLRDGPESAGSMINVTPTFRKAPPGEHWTSAKPEDLMTAVARYAQGEGVPATPRSRNGVTARTS